MPLPSRDPLEDAIALHGAGRHADAERLYREVLGRDPRNAVAHHNLAVLMMQSGRGLDAALPHFKAAWDADPSHQQHWISLMRALARGGDLEAARGVHAEGERRGLRGPTVEMLLAAASSTAVQQAPPAGWKAAGEQMLSIGMLREAEQAFVRAAQASPKDPSVWHGLGVALLQQQRMDEAQAAFRQALQARSDFIPAWQGLRHVLAAQGRHEEMEALARAQVAALPRSASGYIDLGLALAGRGRLHEAEAQYTEALRVQPDSLQARSLRLFTWNYLADRAIGEMRDEAAEFGRRASARATPYGQWAAEPKPSKLRVGLVSGDLGDHPVGFFLESVLAATDRQSIEWVAYPTVPRDDAVTARLRRHIAAWRPIAALDDRAAAGAIHGDGVHVLLDLAGHSANNRLPLFAWRAAPVQASWLGYFATTGVEQMDYLLADETSVPPSDARHFTEKVHYLPDTRLCFTPPATDLAPAEAPLLRNGHVTFGSFQKLTKLNDAVLAAWARVLAQLPAATLRLQARGFDDAAIAAELDRRMAAAGIDRARVSLHRGTSRAEYLAAHAEVDILLDTFPFPGGTTTCEALWMGVPTVTLAGETLVARQGASLLKAAGLGDWVAVSPEDYVALAVAKAREVDALARLRAGMRQAVAASPLFDAPRFARNLEVALWEMWEARGR